jgi:predicted DNA-binding transcriptional regulator AlpA
MSKLPLDEKQLSFIMDCLENRNMSLAQVARQLGIDTSVFYTKTKNIPEIQQYKKKVTRGKTRKNHVTDTLKEKREVILFQSDGSKPIEDLDYTDEFRRRMPRIITEKDMQLLEDVVATGLPMDLVAKELGIPRSTLYQYMNANPEFEERIRLGRARHYKQCEKDVQSGKMDKGLYTFFAKTKWKDIFPQEERFIPALPPLSLQGSLELKQTIVPEKVDSPEE